MATGEGKTLAGALAAAGYAAAGRKVHVHVGQRLPGPPGRRVDGPGVRAARRHGRPHRPGLHPGGAPARRTRREVTYAPVSEIGFDVLRDRLRTERPTGHARAGRGADRRGRLGADRRGPGAAGAGRGRRRPRTATGRWPSSCPELRPGPHYEIDDDGRNVHLTDAGTERPRRRWAGSTCTTATTSTALTQAQRRAARAGAAAPRRRLHRPRRPGSADQRLPRPGRPAAALARRPAGRGRGQGGLSPPATPARSSTASPSSRWSGATRRCAA